MHSAVTRSIGHSMGSQTARFSHPHLIRVGIRARFRTHPTLTRPRTPARGLGPSRAADFHRPLPRGRRGERGASERRAATNGPPRRLLGERAPGGCAQAQTVERRPGGERRWERLRTAVDAPDLGGGGESESRWEDRGGNREAEPGLVILGRTKVKKAGSGHSPVARGLSGVARGRDPGQGPEG